VRSRCVDQEGAGRDDEDRYRRQPGQANGNAVTSLRRHSLLSRKISDEVA